MSSQGDGRRWAAMMVVWAVLGSGCDNPIGGGGGAGLFSGLQGGKEKWTIRCVHVSSAERADHAEYCKALGDSLKRVQGVKATDVRVETTPTGSTIYYGSYTRVESPGSEQLAFSEEFTRDIEMIRRLSVDRMTPFFYAKPEQIGGGSSPAGPYDVSTAQGKYTLQIAFFYNTPTFTERKQAAEQYVQLLRNEGYKAFLRHEVTRSFVFVGEFGEEAMIRQPDGRVLRYGPEVERLIAQNEEYFRYVLENGFLRKRTAPTGEMIATPSFLVPVPKSTDEGSWEQ